jgi:hypothetical protein
MSAKGIWPYIAKLPPIVLRAYLICGFLNKRSKGAVKFFQNRWVIMVGSHPLLPNVESELVLTDASLPRWMRTNHLYYFKASSPGDTSEMQGEIPARLCSVKVKDMSKSRDSGFTFILDMGTRMYHFNTEDEADLTRWTQAVRFAQESAQEVSSSATGRPRQIRKLLEVYDSQGPKALKDKLTVNFNKALVGLPSSVASIIPVLDVCSKLKPELIATIDGCISSNPRRQDVADLYTGVFHTMLCDLLKKHWSALHSSMPNEELLLFAEWLMVYDEQLRAVEVADDKLPNGAKVLCKTYCQRVLKEMMSRLVELMSVIHETTPMLSPDGLLVSSCYSELAETLQSQVSKCTVFKIPFLTPFVLNLCREVVYFYLYAMQELLLRDINFKLEFMAAVCNDSTLLADKLAFWATVNDIGQIGGQSLGLETLTSSLEMVCRLARRRLEEYFIEQLQRSMTTGITDTSMVRPT